MTTVYVRICYDINVSDIRIIWIMPLHVAISGVLICNHPTGTLPLQVGLASWDLTVCVGFRQLWCGLAKSKTCRCLSTAGINLYTLVWPIGIHVPSWWLGNQGRLHVIARTCNFDLGYGVVLQHAVESTSLWSSVSFFVHVLRTLCTHGISKWYWGDHPLLSTNWECRYGDATSPTNWS